MKKLFIALIALSSFSVFAQDISQALRLTFRAANLAKIRNTDGPCGGAQEVYQMDIIKLLKEAVKLDPSMSKRIAGDPQLQKAMSGNLVFQELAGVLKPNMVGLEAALAKAYFETVSMGAYGPNGMLQFKPKGKIDIKTLEITDDGFEHHASKGTYQILSKSKNSAKVKVNGEVFTLKKVEMYQDSLDYILESKKDEGAEYRQHSLFNIPSECEA